MKGQMGGAFFPISIESFRSSVSYTAVREERFQVLGAPVSTLYVLHPGTTLAYRIELEHGSLVYVPDNELLLGSIGPQLSDEALRLAEFAAGTSLLIHDATYSREIYE